MLLAVIVFFAQKELLAVIDFFAAIRTIAVPDIFDIGTAVRTAMHHQLKDKGTHNDDYAKNEEPHE